MNPSPLQTEESPHRAVLVFTDIRVPRKEAEQSLFRAEDLRRLALQNMEESELRSLTAAVFVHPESSVRFKIAKPNPATLIGSGQLKKLAEAAAAAKADIIVFNADISPRIQRNLEAVLDLCVIDRREVIIRIFADRAETREAVLQARLARLEYSMPRLTRRWIALEQQRGGVKGSRGLGEKRLELDKRRLRAEIVRLKKDIEKVRMQRGLRRKSRMTGGQKIGAVVGYTNAGKSSLLKKLSGTDIFAEDKLFATLDAETRKVYLPDGTRFLLTDTVGFVSGLPHQLIDAFRSTLEEAALADFLLIVCDASHPAVSECLSVTETILEELHCGEKTKLVVINKTDSVFDSAEIAKIKARYPDSAEISLKTGAGLDALKTRLSKLVKKENTATF